ncbi:MAG: hypothetical protein LBI04_03165 [Treponema sp.]|jgi:hypothetical protein|nr:hypothetical protein [Treponema sp.]
MNKIYAFPGIALILFFVFACTMPSSVEIKGTPSLKFAANINFGDFFSDMIDDVLNPGDNDVQILDCTNPELDYKTFLLHIEVFRNEDYKIDEENLIDIGQAGIIIINDVEIPVEAILGDSGNKTFVVQEEKIISSSNEPYTVPSTGFENYLEGFGFAGLKSKMYISGSQLAKVVDIKLFHVDSEGNEISLMQDDEEETFIGESGVEFLEEYTGLDLPSGGKEVDIADIINGKDDLSITYKIFIPKYAEVDVEWLIDPNPQAIVVEIVVWLEMAFEPIEDNAQFKFQNFFDGIGDVFKSLAETGIIENMNMKIVLHPLNPFGNGIFVIEDDRYVPIQCPLDDNSFSINFKEEDVKYINKHSFNPNFYIVYPQKDTILGIPNGDIMITTVSVGAKLKYNVEF